MLDRTVVILRQSIPLSPTLPACLSSVSERRAEATAPALLLALLHSFLFQTPHPSPRPWCCRAGIKRDRHRVASHHREELCTQVPQSSKEQPTSTGIVSSGDGYGFEYAVSCQGLRERSVASNGFSSHFILYNSLHYTPDHPLHQRRFFRSEPETSLLK